MRSGVCPKCASSEVYTAYGKSTLDSGLRADEGQPLLHIRIPKSGLLGDDHKFLYVDGYVCQNCGYIEQYAHDLYELRQVSKSNNWRPVKG